MWVKIYDIISLLFKEWKRKYPLGIKKLIQNKTNYDYRLIEQDLLANKEKLTFKQHVVGIIFAFRKRVFKFKSNKRCFMLFGFWVKY